MKLHWLLLACLLLQACALPQQQSSDSSIMDVDAADSLNIADFHSPAANDKDAAPSDHPATDNPASAIVARASYQPSKGPAAAYTSIHQTLYKACPAGWSKQEEWTQNDDGLFYLYISARCR